MENDEEYADDTQNWASLESKQQHYAAQRNCEIRVAYANEALIDIDSAEALAIFKYRWETFRRAESAATYQVKPSPSGKFGHHHVVVQLPRVLGPYERLFIQSILGDDPLRGLLNYKESRDYGNPESVSVLFEKKRAVKK